MTLTAAWKSARTITTQGRISSGNTTRFTKLGMLEDETGGAVDALGEQPVHDQSDEQYQREVEPCLVRGLRPSAP